MTEPPTDQRDYRGTVFLPKTAFPMKAGLPQKEPGILARWQADGLYQRLREHRAGREKFIFHDGPPYANGDMHIGHALNHILKDMVVRTQTLLGKNAPYVPGWDCHGLPIEWKVEEQYRQRKRNKDEVDPLEFRAECRTYAQHWVDTQREQLKRLGINADWDNPYLTMDAEAEATIVSELMKFAASGQLYRGSKPVMWSPVEKTALAEAEIEYEDVVSTQIDVAFEIVESPIPELVGAHAVVWTTTPWTIPVNQAIAYGPEVEYVAYRVSSVTFEGPSVRAFPSTVLVAKPLAGAFWPRTQAHGYEAVWTGKGSDLAGTIARHPIYNLLRHPRESGNPASSGGTEEQRDPRLRGDDGEVLADDTAWERALEFFARPRPFLPGEFVTTDTGTGLVHMAPDHGEDDFVLCKSVGIEPAFAVEADGKYRADWGWLGGKGSVINDRFNSIEGPILQDLQAAGALLAHGKYPHSYPHSWRSKAKVIYRCTPQWFVPMDKPIDRQTPRCADEADIRAAQGEGETLRETALRAIADTRFVPEKGRNRLGSMVADRPDWVLSRQRAWGVPITLFVSKGTNHYLTDPAVNARIVAAVRERGIDAWSEERAQEFLGNDYAAEDYERVTDILDVWFDSGSTHVFVLESGRWPELSWPADLYLEGSDQHRGWFQSSLLESCATRGRAPFKAILTHGFTMDAKGLKMSKSLGNTTNPLDLMRDSGADILRLWALTIDFTEDHRIGKEILAGVSDQYRKLRNTFRYLLGALDGFDEELEAFGRVRPEDMPELERYMLALLARLDATLKQAVEDYDFNTYVRALSEFCNEDLSAFFFDIRKDSLYCDAPADPKRRAYRTVLDTLFHALVRYAAPVLVFTSEEVWGTRYPDEGSVHLLEWPLLPTTTHPRHSREGGNPSPEGATPATPEMDPRLRGDDELIVKWEGIRRLRSNVTGVVEIARRDKAIGSSLEAEPDFAIHSSADWAAYQAIGKDLFVEICIVANVHVREAMIDTGITSGITGETRVTTHHKCGRCWRHLPEVAEDGALCSRCENVVAGMDAVA